MKVRAQVMRWLSDEPQPGIIEVQLVDVEGRPWLLRDKTAIFEHVGGLLTRETAYPVDVAIPCDVVELRRDLQNRQMVQIRLAWGLADDQIIEVFQDQLTA
jgi:hypothetical protein